MRASPVRIRIGAVALATAGVSFLLYPLLRPWEDETTVVGATAAMSSSAWVASHGFAMIGFVLLGLGVLAAWGAVHRTAGEPVALLAVLLTWVGIGLTLPYYGAETFGLHAVAAAVDAGEALDVVAIADGFRYDPVAVTSFGLGLTALAAGIVALAIAVRRSGILSPGAGLLLAAGFVLFLPQFFAPPAGRIAHGVLVAAGCLWTAWSLWTSGRTAHDADVDRPPMSGHLD
ncbi:hypothetical protein ER308_01875 [Egibacter rhizosphaerae]|uniref:DUF998 domain-containing protein n=1 Tax=Egibacter rhizosphaerae TaxID=1670831 RepID=A0A411YBA0_9ACTN|nr:hypothetical protein [Egibacter rhizosphaerae]QBI18437.1 hypothetical protein ER308_01875 [Egibacter rhizosphaerae]